MRAGLCAKSVFLTIHMFCWQVAPVLAQQQTSRQAEVEVLSIDRLQGVARKTALRRILVGSRSDGCALRQSLLYYEGRIRPDLRSLVGDSDVGPDAAYLLALIGVPDDLQFIIQSPPPPMLSALSDRWADFVARSLLEPSTEDEWEFLRKCALNEYNDRWADSGAIQTLKLIASPRSRTLLEEAQIRNPSRAQSLAQALTYVGSAPGPLDGSDLGELVARVGPAIKIGNWDGTSKPRKNETGDKAFVDYRFFTGEDVLTYTATFHQVRGVWRLRGVHETMQEFAPPRVTLPRPLPRMLPPPEVQPPVQR